MALKNNSLNKKEKSEKETKAGSSKKATRPREEKEANPDLIKFGEKIKQRRIEIGFSNADFFAYENNIARSQYSRYESGREDLRLSSVLKLLRALKIKPSEFFKDFD